MSKRNHEESASSSPDAALRPAGPGWKFIGAAGAISTVTAILLVVAGTLAVATFWPASRSVAGSNSVSASVSPASSSAAPTDPAPEGMVWVPGGEFTMGSLDPRGGVCGGHEAMQDARPLHRVYVDGFWMDATVVTNAQFEKFTQATGYVTIAERKPTKEEFPTAPPENLVAGSTVFTPTPGPIPLDDYFRW
jgi:formylglycine-generating enzyme required for sulfatase activity